MIRRISVLLPSVVLACATSSVAMAQQAPAANPPGLTHTAVLTGRDLTWDMAFLPDGTMFFTEKCRGLSVRLPSGTVNSLLGMKDSKGYADTAGDLFVTGNYTALWTTQEGRISPSASAFVRSSASTAAA